MISEIILEDKGEIKVARVLLKYNLPVSKYPEFGTWCYLINAKKKIVVFDTGPKFKAFRPMFRKFSKNLNNDDLIMQTLEKYFPGKTVREIIFSHFHYDHSELAPELQIRIKKKFGNIPPIRLHKMDSGSKKILNVYEHGIEKVYKEAGYKEWKLGSFVKEGETIKDTDFKIIHLPGHTKGTVGLISQKYKIVICGWWIDKIEKKVVAFSMKLINEDNKILKKSMKKGSFEGYNYYYYHPKVQKKKRVLMFIRKILGKRVSVFCSSQNNIDEKYLDLANALGKELVARDAKIFFGGQDSGMMKNLADSVLKYNGKLISVFAKTDKNVFKKCRTISVMNSRRRTRVLINRSDIIVCLPGGFGTLEELHNSILINQTSKTKKPILLLNLDGFYNPLLAQYDNIYKNNFSKQETLFEVFTSLNELLVYLDSIKLS